MTISWLLAYVIIGWGIRVTMVSVILRREMAPGASIAWLGVIFLHPYIGLGLYLLFGETRLGPGRMKAHQDLVLHFRSAPSKGSSAPGTAAPPYFSAVPPPYEPMVLQAQHISMMPVLGGNTVDFINSIENLVPALVADINAAKSQVHLLYYMFAHDGSGDPVAAALEAAVRRGVTCRVLVDAVASRSFFHFHNLGGKLKRAGVHVAAALPANLIARRLPRMDLRNHRKLAIIDQSIAYAGSHNLINADYGGSPAAPWVDVTGRFTGPVVGELALVFAEDWAFETGEILQLPAVDGSAHQSDAIPMQVVPTGPSDRTKTYRRLLLAAVQASRRQLILTSPYFVPDEPTVLALMMAADRGVDVNLLLPKNPDHLFTAAAGRAHFDRLLEAGVAIHLYRPGLLHAKTATVDDAFALFGSANLDVRSFQLNFELSLLLYGSAATERLRTIQRGYLADCDRVDAKQWAARPVARQYADRAVSLLSPLL